MEGKSKTAGRRKGPLVYWSARSSEKVLHHLCLYGEVDGDTSYQSFSEIGYQKKGGKAQVTFLCGLKMFMVLGLGGFW